MATETLETLRKGTDFQTGKGSSSANQQWHQLLDSRLNGVEMAIVKVSNPSTTELEANLVDGEIYFRIRFSHSESYTYTNGYGQFIDFTRSSSEMAHPIIKVGSKAISVTGTIRTSSYHEIYYHLDNTSGGKVLTLDNQFTESELESGSAVAGTKLTYVRLSYNSRNRHNDATGSHSGMIKYRLTSGYLIDEAYFNSLPALILNSPTDASTLYENEVFNIAGTVTDLDVGNVVSVKYSINGGAARAILGSVSQGSALAFAKNLTYKSGKLYDGATAITATLAEGSQHNIKIWAEDDQGGKSIEITRSFYVIPNRAATLTLDAFVTRTGLINTDVVNITGKVADLDNGNVIVKYKIGNGAFVQVYNGPATGTPTPFNFNVLLADLADGANQITIQAVDAYNAITQQVLSLTKTANEQPLLNAVTYYEITPPNGATDGLQLYIERELGDLVVSADVFMGASGETEVFVPMTLASTANLTNGNVEDTFSYQHSTDATKVVIRINMSRASAATNKAIKKISGVLT